MLRLTDDCLCHIFDRLEFRDQIRLTSVCERFRDIIVAVQWRSLYRRFEYKSEIHALSREDYESLFKLIAHRIERICINCENLFPNERSHLRFEFPVLRVLECRTQSFTENYMKVIVVYCPLIEELYLHNYIWRNLCPYIVLMSHLRVLDVPRWTLSEYDVKQILNALPLTKLCFQSLELESGDPRPFSEVVIGARNLQVMRMRFDSKTPSIMWSMVALATTTERRYPLTIYISYAEDSILNTNYKGSFKNKGYEGVEYDEDDGDSKDDDFLDFQEYQRSLKTFFDIQRPGSPHTILLSKRKIECRFFCQSNKK